jgi:LacI family transcriptional regulator
VIHKRGRVAPETVERVERVIREVGYKPNRMARQLSLARRYTFGIIMPELTQDSGYWKLPKQGMERAAAELELANVTTEYFHYDRYSAVSFQRACDRAIDAELDGLLLAPVLSHPAQEFIHRIQDRIPYVLFDAKVPETREISFIGQDSYQSGVIAGRLMHLLAPEGGSMAVVTAGTDDFHLARRAAGFVSTFQGDAASSIEEVHITEHRDIAEQLGNALGERRVAGYFVTNATGHWIAEMVNGPRRRGEPDASEHTPIIAYDLIPENAECLRWGIIDFIISQRPELQGYQAFTAAYKQLVLQEAPQETITMPIDIVMKENLEHYLSASRWLPA